MVHITGLDVITIFFTNGMPLKTLSGTLIAQSAFFRALLSDRSTLCCAEDDGTPCVFIDTDAVLFTHLLEYLQRGAMPLLWTPDKGFDLAGYARLAALARTLGVDAVYDWVAANRFRHAVSLHVSSRAALVREEEPVPRHAFSADGATQIRVDVLRPLGADSAGAGVRGGSGSGEPLATSVLTKAMAVLRLEALDVGTPGGGETCAGVGVGDDGGDGDVGVGGASEGEDGE